ncbi:hypothetical protein LP414_02055 [Polaromonas sp. P1(28)-13]|nr:hypothetical protein LP414_02055 [Polaromonas sp. P1(28)-13]
MPTFSLSVLQATFAAAVFCLASASHAQAPQLPPPESTDPVGLELMKGFPSPPDKIVRLATVLKYPNARWAFHHMRELGPTANIRRGAGAPSALRDDTARWMA